MCFEIMKKIDKNNVLQDLQHFLPLLILLVP